MTSPLYNASVPVMQQMLRALSDVLKKAEDHATQKNIDPNALLQARLFPDMFPLVRQVQIAADFSKGIASRLAGAEVPSWPDTEVSFADLQALIAKLWPISAPSSRSNSIQARAARSYCAPAPPRKRS
ncbi:hypothetical protein M2282_002763 [Variovorax boronicumulans]|nr:hypothetical protein [Variovorax boronicumulans]